MDFTPCTFQRDFLLEIFGTSLLNLISIPKTCVRWLTIYLTENGMMVNILKSGDKRNKKTINQDGFELKNVPMNNMSFSSLPPTQVCTSLHSRIYTTMEWSVGVVFLQGDMIGVGHIMLLVASAFLTIILHSPLFNQYCMDSYYYFVQGDRKKSIIRVVRQVNYL